MAEVEHVLEVRNVIGGRSSLALAIVRDPPGAGAPLANRRRLDMYESPQ